MRKSSSIENRSLIASLLVGLASTLPAAAAVLHVPSQFTHIQAAVDAASSGDTIRIAAGVYQEQVLIVSKNLTLVGAPGAVLKAAPGLLETLLPIDPTAVNVRPVLGVALSDNVVVKGLTVDGDHLGETEYIMLGILFHGSSGSMEHCTVRGFRGNSGLELGHGMAAGNFEHLARPQQHVRVLDNVFEDNWISIQVVGRQGDESGPDVPRLNFLIENNIISGVGPTDTGTQEGINIRPGASGEVKRNVISDHNSVGPAFTFSFGINASDPTGNLTPLQPVLYEGNTFRNNQEHIFATSADNSRFVNNTFRGSSLGTRPNGIAASGDNIRIVNNDFSDMPTGITLFGDDPDFGTALGITTNAKLIGNRFCEVTTPIDIEPLVTGTVQRGNHVCSPGCRHGGQEDKDDDGRKHDDH